MESKKCEIDGCASEVKVIIAHPTTHAQVEEKCYCDPHGVPALDEIGRKFTCQHCGIEASVDRCAVDIELVVCDGREGSSSQVFLHESDGPRRLAIWIGRFESWLLAWELKHEPIASLSTHQAMANTIQALGGQVKNVTINDVSERERYHAQVHLSQGRSSVVVDMRPSDALVLAVVCNVSVYVDSLVWQKTLGYNGQ